MCSLLQLELFPLHHCSIIPYSSIFSIYFQNKWFFLTYFDSTLFSNKKGFVCHQIVFWGFLHNHSISEQTWNSRLGEYFRKYRTEIHICTCVCFNGVNGWFIITEYLQTAQLKCFLEQTLAEIKCCTLSLEWWLFSTNNRGHTWKTIGTTIR